MRKLEQDFTERAKRYLSFPVRTIDQIAWKLGCDRRTLWRKFKDEVGVTPTDFRKQRTGGVKSFKIARAQRLLRQTDLSVDEITHRVGYRERTALTKAFQNQLSVTPPQYRKKYPRPTIPRNVLEAQKILVETDKTLSEIALQLGYAEHSTLASLFKKNMGESWLDFRRRHWGSDFLPVRVVKAKKLLVDTDLTIDVIAKRLGLKGHKGLTNMIKATEGVTPHVYRLRERERLEKERLLAVSEEFPSVR